VEDANVGSSVPNGLHMEWTASFSKAHLIDRHPLTTAAAAVRFVFTADECVAHVCGAYILSAGLLFTLLLSAYELPVCVCLYASVDVYMCACICVLCMYVYICVCIMYICIYIYNFLYMYNYLCVCVFV